MISVDGLIERIEVMTFEEYGALSDVEREVMLMAVRSSAGATDSARLADRIARFVTIGHLNGECITPRTLSLQYAPGAGRCGVKLNDVLMGLVAEGRIRMIEGDKRRRAFVSPRLWSLALEMHAPELTPGALRMALLNGAR